MVETRPSGYAPIVMDFGLAREATEHRGLTESGAVMGTPAFMSPEQARGDVRNLDRRTDVYSLGATLFDLIAGGPPFMDDSVVNVILKVLTHEAPSLSTRVPDLPKALDIITNKCLAKEPKERYQTAAELAADLDRFLEQKQIVGKRVSLRSRLSWKAKTNRPLAAAVLGFLLTVLGFLGYGVRTYAQNLRKERAAKRQAELAQRLGQEMKDMEWLLRTARGMPLHDLGREKKIVRQRMLALQSEFAGFGAAGQPLAHYALGRGHMGLHEYPEALKELELAIAQGFQQGEAYYALGVVLGKHYEKAMYEARLAGGGDWARKRLQEIEPRYLTPAIVALRRARQSKSASPELLEALIAYYVRDFSAALTHTRTVLEQTPWLYEAHKLTGDIHLEQALQAHDHGQDPEAECELASAVQSFTAAAEIGRSDGEIYEGLAETWVRTIELSANGGRPVTHAYAAAVAASNQIIASEPQSTAGPLKKAYASLMTLGLLGSGTGSAERAQACLTDAQDVLQRQADNPYASAVYAGCLAMAAEGAQAAGKDPVPLLRKALGQLEPAVQKAPYFLWGLNDLANVYLALGGYLQLHGDPAARRNMLKSVEYRAKAVALDASYVIGYQNALYTWANLIPMITSQSELQAVLAQADDVFGRCTKMNSKDVQCFNNYFQVYTAAAQRLLAAGQDPQPMLGRATAVREQARRLGAKFLDTEQADALSHLIAAMDQLRRKQTPAPALQKMQEALARCFALAAQDPLCGSLATQGDWVHGEWAALTGAPSAPILQAAREKALRATQSAPSAADAWWVLAETQLRLSRSAPAQARALQITQGLVAVEKLFAINPNHARGWATRGGLELLLAQSQTGAAAVRSTAAAAAQSLARAVASDPLLTQALAPLREQAQRLSDSP